MAMRELINDSEDKLKEMILAYAPKSAEDYLEQMRSIDWTTAFILPDADRIKADVKEMCFVKSPKKHFRIDEENYTVECRGYTFKILRIEKVEKGRIFFLSKASAKPMEEFNSEVFKAKCLLINNATDSGERLERFRELFKYINDFRSVYIPEIQEVCRKILNKIVRFCHFSTAAAAFAILSHSDADNINILIEMLEQKDIVLINLEGKETNLAKDYLKRNESQIRDLGKLWEGLRYSTPESELAYSTPALGCHREMKRKFLIARGIKENIHNNRYIISAGKQVIPLELLQKPGETHRISLVPVFTLFDYFIDTRDIRNYLMPKV